VSERPRVLLVGPLPCEGDVVGGTKVSFAAMARALGAEPSLDVEVFDTSRAREGRGPVRRLADELATLRRLLARVALGARADVVVFNTSSGGLMKSGWLVRLACRARRSAFVVRVFGGDLDLFVDRASAPSRWLLRRVTLGADLVLLQTKALCERFGGADVRWWPTTRDLAAPGRARGAARRFLFIGQLRAEKGVAEAIEASRALPEGAALTVVGPAMPGFDIGAADLGPRCEYRGAVAPDAVPGLLADHDVLVFPTYHGGEGMPGVVVEAMQSGLPVVATRWRAIPELVEDGESGLLVEPRDARALGDALARIARDEALFQRLAEGASRQGERLRATAWEPRLVDWIGEAAGRVPKASGDATRATS